MPPDPRHAPGDTSDRAPANGHFVAKELTAARSTISEDQTIHLVVKKQAVSRQASSRRDAQGRMCLEPKWHQVL